MRCYQVLPRWGRTNHLQESTLSELISEDISSINIARLLSRDDIDELKIPLRFAFVTDPDYYILLTTGA